MTTLYIAGPMRGLPEYNFPAFIDAAERLRKVGYAVLSPAESDLREGFDPKTGNHIRSIAEYMERDFAMIAQADGLAILPGAEHSEGTRREIFHALPLGKAVLSVDAWLAFTNPYTEPPESCARLFYGSATADSGETRVTDANTGGEKCRKLARFDLLPWDALWEAAEHFGKCGGNGTGPGKYEDRNWERGYAWSLSFGALMRHAAAFWTREDIDAASKSRHTAAMAWHALALLAFQKRGIGTDDRPEIGGADNGE